MKASDLDDEMAAPHDLAAPSAREWLRLVGAGVAIVGICVLWTFWA